MILKLLKANSIKTLTKYLQHTWWKTIDFIFSSCFLFFHTIDCSEDTFYLNRKKIMNFGFNPVAKPARHLVMQMQIFLCFWPYKEWISKEMNNDNDLNLHSMTKLSGWLRYSFNPHSKYIIYEQTGRYHGQRRLTCETIICISIVRGGDGSWANSAYHVPHTLLQKG